MFNVGGGEVLVIALIALIAVGPEQLPSVLRKIGNFVGQARQMSGALRTEFMSGLDAVNSSVGDLNPNKWIEGERGDGTPNNPIVPRASATKGDSVTKSASAKSEANESQDAFAPIPGTPGAKPVEASQKSLPASDETVSDETVSDETVPEKPTSEKPGPNGEAAGSAESQLLGEIDRAAEEPASADESPES